MPQYDTEGERLEVGVGSVLLTDDTRRTILHVNADVLVLELAHEVNGPLVLVDALGASGDTRVVAFLIVFGEDCAEWYVDQHRTNGNARVLVQLRLEQHRQDDAESFCESCAEAVNAVVISRRNKMVFFISK